MNIRNKIFLCIMAITLSACYAHTPYRHFPRAVTGAALGAAGGALIGHSVDPYNGVYAGTAIGALVGGAIGYSMDGHGYHKRNHGHRRHYNDHGYGRHYRRHPHNRHYRRHRWY